MTSSFLMTRTTQALRPVLLSRDPMRLRRAARRRRRWTALPVWAHPSGANSPSLSFYTTAHLRRCGTG
ncbi:hypothetical protein DPMN_106256 [Dreissena polymorpha]|uniref:Uncharacterized protein n=1 Tax=Dreissena polymorpha TaxID=45954 RepID=A0A9D4K4P2_DREPO|nr:hypothetical protein DPMN_106256 [Dreissena polymorpha]